MEPVPIKPLLIREISERGKPTRFVDAQGRTLSPAELCAAYGLPSTPTPEAIHAMDERALRLLCKARGLTVNLTDDLDNDRVTVCEALFPAIHPNASQAIAQAKDRVKATRHANIAAKKRPPRPAKKRPAPRPAPAPDPNHHWLLPVNAPEKTKEMRRRAWAECERELEDLAREINAAHEAAQAAATTAIEHAIACGKALIKAKAKVGHGNWLPWLEKNCKALISRSQRTAQVYIQLAKRVDSNPQHAADLTSIRQALADVSALPAPEPEATNPPEPISLVAAFEAKPAATHDQISAALKGRQDATELLDALRREIERWRKANQHRPQSWIGEALRLLAAEEAGRK